MKEETGIVITLQGEDFLVAHGKEEIKLLVIPLGIEDIDDAVSVVESIDSATGKRSYSAIIPEYGDEHGATWEKAIKVAGIVMANIETLRENGVLS